LVAKCCKKNTSFVDNLFESTTYVIEFHFVESVLPPDSH